MLEYWTPSNRSSVFNGSDEGIEEVLQDPGSVELFVDYPPSLLYFAAGCCILFMLIGIPGNLITVVALFRTKKLRNATAIFIMNLSISDLMFCCFNLPLATSTFWHGSWRHGPLLCQLFPFLRYGLLAVSLFTILAITINRYVMIGHPALYPKLYKRKYLIPMVLATWIFSFGVLIVTWFGEWGRFGLDTVIGSCSILPDEYGHSPKEFLFVLAFVTPCVAIVVCYARIFYIVRKTTKRSRKREKLRDRRRTDLEPRAVPLQNDEEISVLGSSCVATALCGGFASKKPSSAHPFPSPEDSSKGEKQKGMEIENMKDIPFADEPESSENANANFLPEEHHKTNQESNPKVTSARKRLERMASRTSFILEPSLWMQRIISSGNHEINPASSNKSEILTNSQTSITNKPDIRRGESRARSLRRKQEIGPRVSTRDRKLLKMILVIFLSFVVCYLPITVTKIFKSTVDWRGLNIAGYLLIYLTTCINPVIYVVMSSEYRSAYKNVLLCRVDTMGAKTERI